MKMTLAELLAKKGIKPVSAVNPTIIVQPTAERKETFSTSIILDEDQKTAVQLAAAGKSFCIIGKAGTGKTTTERELIKAVLKTERLKGETHVFKIQGTKERISGPAAAVVAYTRIASGNSKRAICKESELEFFAPNITTVHNFLEFEPEFYWNPETQKDSMRFVPRRHAANPLTTRMIAFEEASMIDLPLWEKVFVAMKEGTQCIFIGDINQLPPVFGPSILNYALVQLPIVELRTVYRQAFNSLVLKNAHNILDGNPLEYGPDFKLIEGGPKQHGQHIMATLFANTMKKWYEAGEYNPETDIVLTPFGKQALGSTSLNSHIAQFLNQNEVWEVIAGRRKLYLAVGDKIMYNKQVGYIKEIDINRIYAGKSPRPPSKHLTRFGVMHHSDFDLDDMDEDNGLAGVDVDLEAMAQEDIEELTHQASNVVTIELQDTGEVLRLRKTGEFSEAIFSLAYALTVHKSQGCEWRKVIIVLHKDHSIMAFNELLYTAVTRASEKVVLIAKQFMIDKAIANRRLKGNSIAEKIEFFNANMTLNGVSCTKKF